MKLVFLNRLFRFDSGRGLQRRTQFGCGENHGLFKSNRTRSIDLYRDYSAET
jgi:hypothetical protein